MGRDSDCRQQPHALPRRAVGGLGHIVPRLEYALKLVMVKTTEVIEGKPDTTYRYAHEPQDACGLFFHRPARRRCLGLRI